MVQASVIAPEAHVFGPYRLVALLGQDSLTATYRAEQPALHRWVAIKLLPRPAAPAEFPVRFGRAAEDWARLEHPHVLSLQDYGQCQGVPYLVTPFIAAGSFEQRLSDGAGREDALGVLLHVTGALAYAHRQRVVHGAVTPSSILLREGHGPALTDFGLGRLLQATGAAPPSGVYGTPEYLAPEQVRGAPLDGRADVYALGVILYRILAGGLPFTGGSAAQVLAHQCETPWRPLELARPEASRVWNAVLVHALAKAPSERYATAEALGAAIQTAMRQEQALRAEPSRAVVWQPARPAAAWPSAVAPLPITATGAPPAAAAPATRPATPTGAGPAPGRPAPPTPGAAPRWLGAWVALGALLGLALLAIVVVQSPGVPDVADATPRSAVASGLGAAPDEAADAGELESAGPAILVQDDFSDPNSGWPRQSSDLATRRIGYVDGEYSIVKVANSPGAPFVSRGSQLGDFLWEIDVRLQPPTESAYVFLDFRRQENGDHYSFILDPNDGTFKLDCELGQGRDEVLRWTPSAAIRRGAALNRVGVRAEGGTLTLLANGEEVAHAQDERLHDGGIAFGVSHFRNGGADARFDNLLVTALPSS
jgi:hypothetical protein